ncbi:hypothetical protein Zmor_009285 [Zophobas morio]|uniref:Uncharacterized protein n=1 Tax=Zophobas morio TaxID=2755281 RepID=A0AA38MIL1_9CUCU|nr:hypothetical protein Zmor_009285 [Zophobas morio]
MSIWPAFLALLTLTNALDQDFVDDFMEKIQEIGTVCAEETHATSDDIAELLARQIPPSTHEGKCMIFCIQTNFKVMKADGSIDRAGAMLALKPLQKADPQLYQKVLKLFVTCGMRVKPLPDPCDTASALAECAKNEAEAMGLDESVMMG